jgi:hypothetical protein
LVDLTKPGLTGLHCEIVAVRRTGSIETHNRDIELMAVTDVTEPKALTVVARLRPVVPSDKQQAWEPLSVSVPDETHIEVRLFTTPKRKKWCHGNASGLLVMCLLDGHCSTSVASVVIDGCTPALFAVSSCTALMVLYRT